jgi:hypothetical protein
MLAFALPPDPLDPAIPPFHHFYISGWERWKTWWNDGGTTVENGGTADFRHFSAVEYHCLAW